jgi:peptide-methionine (S)-S-oxide reductase
MTTHQSLVLGGGCFWCVDAAYELLPGVVAVVSGYAGGARPNPTYEQVCAGVSGHAEVVRIDFDPAQIPLEALLDFFWQIHDPTTLNRQGADEGTQYRSVIFYADAAQQAAAEASLARANPSWGGRIVTQLAPLVTFYEAEAHHQDYFRRNPHGGYCQAVIRPKIKKLKAALGTD